MLLRVKPEARPSAEEALELEVILSLEIPAIPLSC
jgi:hypothetical protein